MQIQQNRIAKCSMIILKQETLKSQVPGQALRLLSSGGCGLFVLGTADTSAVSAPAGRRATTPRTPLMEYYHAFVCKEEQLWQ